MRTIVWTALAAGLLVTALAAVAHTPKTPSVKKVLYLSQEEHEALEKLRAAKAALAERVWARQEERAARFEEGGDGGGPGGGQICVGIKTETETSTEECGDLIALQSESGWCERTCYTTTNYENVAVNGQCVWKQFGQSYHCDPCPCTEFEDAEDLKSYF